MNHHMMDASECDTLYTPPRVIELRVSSVVNECNSIVIHGGNSPWVNEYCSPELE
jgi:hypothetical protein